MAISNIQIRLSGEEVEISEAQKIAVNFQNYDVADIGSMKGDYTQEIVLPNTDTNNRILKNSGVIGADDKLLYSSIEVDIIVNGVFILSKGSAIIKSHDELEGYRLNIFGRNIDFFSAIKDRTLKDLDLSAYNFDPADYETLYEATFNASSGMCWPLVDQSSFGRFQSVGLDTFVHYQQQIPWFYKKTLLEKIVSEAGFIINGELLDDNLFNKTVCSTAPPDGQEALRAGLTGNDLIMSDWMHEIQQVDFVKSLLVQHNAYVTNFENILTFNLFKNVPNGKFSADDWSEKIDLTNSVLKSYDVGFAVNNIIEYAEPKEEGDKPLRDYVDYLESERRQIIQSRNKNLTFEKTIGSIISQSTRLVGNNTFVGNEIYLPNLDLIDDPTIAFDEQYNDKAVYRELVVNELTYKDFFNNPITFKATAGIAPGAASFNMPVIFTGFWAAPVAGTGTTIQQNNGQLSVDYLRPNYYRELEQYFIDDPLDKMKTPLTIISTSIEL